MLSRSNDNHHSFVYHNLKEPLTEAARISSIGLEKRTSTDYYWDGRLRQTNLTTCIFQYTLNGYGEVRVGEKTYTVKPGEAFFVKVPSHHCYYLPEKSPEWEFIFITLEGTKAEECWDYLSSQFELIVPVDANAPLIFSIQKIYQFALTEGIEDTFTSSAFAYEFIMGLYRFAKGLDNQQTGIPDDILMAIQFMMTRYHEPLSLESIAEHAGLSKYYFTNKFQKYMKTTPIQYLTKRRIQKAMELLSTTNKTIQEIARETGYDNANYFSKVFKKMIGNSADSFRKDKKLPDFEHVIID
ncbi:AraC family transcriptional regulator [Peribacillus muralis]|uniref:AraC family transcriptional regulator n=1 Tax=Peribacillus muralis TaxID=264697 RepID=UPI001F4D64CC|nr:AraC family transcriptional regulator [Peribacillus muralis]MCK1993775.1 AraC family transcriptional regulator [Peribacillus muralis]MCK2013936.1 AraC family transcriptional regulator [Peribacillus muralis]